MCRSTQARSLTVVACVILQCIPCFLWVQMHVWWSDNDDDLAKLSLTQEFHLFDGCKWGWPSAGQVVKLIDCWLALPATKVFNYRAKMVTMGINLQPGRLADRLLTGLDQPQVSLKVKGTVQRCRKVWCQMFQGKCSKENVPTRCSNGDVSTEMF